MESSLDTLLACSIMVIVTLGSMSGVITTVQPYLQNQSSHGWEMNYRLAEILLLDEGEPNNWGSKRDTQPIRPGLGSGSKIQFELDIDKVTRLDPENAYSLDFVEFQKSLGLQDKAIKIRFRSILKMTLELVSRIAQEDHVTYYFEVNTKKSGLPVSAGVHAYTILGDHVLNLTTSTSDSGSGLLEVELSNSLSGVVLLVGFAKMEPRMVTSCVVQFTHNSEEKAFLAGTHLALSPLNYTLEVELRNQSELVSGAMVLTYGYCFNLTKIETHQTTESYIIPRLLDNCPMVLAVIGRNDSSFFNEWTEYPPFQFEFGSGLIGKNDPMNLYSFCFLVDICSILCECEIIIGEGSGYA